MDKPIITHSNGRYCVKMLAPWYYVGNKTEPLGHTLIEGYGHNLQAAWGQFEYWWLTLMGEKYEQRIRIQ